MTDKGEYRKDLRLEAIGRLKLFESFVPSVLSQVPPQARIFRHLWVDTEAKSRLAMQDRKTEDTYKQITHVPTPSTMTNNILECLAVLWGWHLVVFDIVAAFPHAAENEADICRTGRGRRQEDHQRPRRVAHDGQLVRSADHGREL